MPKKSKEETVTSLVSVWKPRLLLDQWAVMPTIKETTEDQPYDKTLATVEVIPRYTDARMEIYPQFWLENSGAQRAAIVHELLHIPLHQIREALAQAVKKGLISEKRKDDLVEGVVEYITKVLVKAYSRNKKPSGGYVI